MRTPPLKDPKKFEDERVAGFRAYGLGFKDARSGGLGIRGLEFEGIVSVGAPIGCGIW